MAFMGHASTDKPVLWFVEIPGTIVWVWSLVLKRVNKGFNIQRKFIFTIYKINGKDCLYIQNLYKIFIRNWF